MVEEIKVYIKLGSRPKRYCHVLKFKNVLRKIELVGYYYNLLFFQFKWVNATKDPIEEIPELTFE